MLRSSLPVYPLVGFCLLAAASSGCASPEFMPGTTVPDTPVNRKIVETVEKYRNRLVERNVDGLMVLAHQDYFEDGGTPTAADDYGYAGLQSVLEKRLIRLKSLRYEIQYRAITVTGRQADVDVYVDGSFEVTSSEVGSRYRRVNDHHRFRLVQDEKDYWRFLSGM